MFPAIISTAGGIIKGIPRFIWKIGFFVVVAAAAYILLRKLIKQSKYNVAQKNYATNTPEGLATVYAAQMYNAIIPSGHEFWNDWGGDGTEEDLIFQTATEMYRNKITLGMVGKQYKSLYNRDLVIDLNRDLDGTELAKLNKILASGLSGLDFADQQRIEQRMYNAKKEIIYSQKPLQVLDEQLKPVNSITGNVKLGEHVQTWILPNKVLLGFDYKGATRFVDQEAVILQEVI